MNKLANDIANAVNYKLAGLGLAKYLPTMAEHATAGAIGAGLGSLGGRVAGFGTGALIGGARGLANVIRNRRDNSLMTQIKRGLGLAQAPSLDGDVAEILSSAGAGGNYGHNIGGLAGAIGGGIHGLTRGARYGDDIGDLARFALY